MGQPAEKPVKAEREPLTDEQKELLLEYAEWFDDPGDSPENFVKQFAEYRDPVKE